MSESKGPTPHLCWQCNSQFELADARFCPFCGASEPWGGGDPSVFTITGTTLKGTYRIGKRLGGGGMGSVYKATHLLLDKSVVIKLLNPSLADDSDTVKRFFLEARAIARLDHPNTVRVYDFGTSEELGYFMAMEFIDGPTLGELIHKEHPFDAERIADLITQVLGSVGEAHEKGVVHRDLKPHNIMLKRQGSGEVVKVLDFGLAKIRDERFKSLTMAGMVCGTPEYMSPEQARGESLDRRTDIYSVGVILYQMLAGQVPFDAESPMGILSKHVNDLPAPPTTLEGIGDVDPILEEVCLRAMSKDPAERFQTTADMLEAISPLLRPETQPTTMAGRTRRPKAPPVSRTVETPKDDERPAVYLVEKAPGRRHPRYRVAMRVAVAFPSQESFSTFYTRDVSLGGFFLERRPDIDGLQIFDTVELTLMLPNGDTLPLRGKVVHEVSEDRAKTKGGVAGWGIQLATLPPEVGGRLQKALEALKVEGELVPGADLAVDSDKLRSVRKSALSAEPVEPEVTTQPGYRIDFGAMEKLREAECQPGEFDGAKPPKK